MTILATGSSEQRMRVLEILSALGMIFLLWMFISKPRLATDSVINGFSDVCNNASSGPRRGEDPHRICSRQPSRISEQGAGSEC